MAYRRFLPADHPWRRKKCFDGQVEERGKPEEFTLEELMQQLERVKDVRPGKHPQSKKRKRMKKMIINAGREGLVCLICRIGLV